MSFYLVTYTALVEADDEIAAAEKVASDLQVENRMTFTVKRDENSIKHVSVTRQADVLDERSAAQPAINATTAAVGDGPGSGSVEDVQPAVADLAKPKSSAGRIGAVFLALSFVACGLAGLFHFTSLRLF